MTIKTTDVQRISIHDIQRMLWKLKPGCKVVAEPFSTDMIFRRLYIEDNTIRVELSYDDFPNSLDHCLLENIHEVII
jgi:hypothetical protein